MGRVIHHQTHPIGQSHVKNDTLDDEKAQERWDFTLLTLSKEAQAVSITDCQAGNPNPEGDRCLFDLSKPLPLNGCLGHLSVASEYFFNNDMEYLKSNDSIRKYTTSITKTMAARYELVGIEDMIPK
ncbi:hypothetical protein Tco_1089836 [Tanacetum coccineum]